jgi:hypothetical protein
MNSRLKRISRGLPWSLGFAALLVAGGAVALGLRPSRVVVGAMIISWLIFVAVAVMACVQDVHRFWWSVRWCRWSRRMAQGDELREQGRCASCGYDLTGNVSGRCPECGAIASAEHAR